MEKILLEIAGEIALSDDPGQTMKKWREIFNVSQAELAKYLGISVSTISDYENNRRKSPGSSVIKRFVLALFEIDLERGSPTISRFKEKESLTSEYFEVHEFARSIPLQQFVDLIGGKVLTNHDLLEEVKIYGYTLINSLKVILDMPYTYFQKLYGNVNQRVFLFTGVSTGRSPFVVVRVSSSKPSAIVLHNLKEKNVDRLALKISEKERIPLIITSKSLDEIKEILNRI